MEDRGTGLPVRRPPPAWEKRPILTDLTKQVVQGPSDTMGPQRRDATPQDGGFMGAVLRNRPSAIYAEARSGQAPLPPDVIDVIADGGSYNAQILAGAGSMGSEALSDGGPGNISGTVQGDMAIGSATRTTGKSVIGQTLGKGTI